MPQQETPEPATIKPKRKPRARKDQGEQQEEGPKQQKKPKSKAAAVKPEPSKPAVVQDPPSESSPDARADAAPKKRPRRSKQKETDKEKEMDKTAENDNKMKNDQKTKDVQMAKGNGKGKGGNLDNQNPGRPTKVKTWAGRWIPTDAHQYIRMMAIKEVFDACISKKVRTASSLQPPFFSHCTRAFKNKDMELEHTTHEEWVAAAEIEVDAFLKTDAARAWFSFIKSLEFLI